MWSCGLSFAEMSSVPSGRIRSGKGLGLQPTMEKRVVIFLVLSIAVILGYDLLLKQFGLLPQSPPTKDHVAPAPPPGTEDSTNKNREPVPASPSGPSSTAPGIDHRVEIAGSEPPPPQPDRTGTVETNLVRVSLGSQGGVITGWELKQYRSSPKEPKPVQLVYQGGKFRGPLSIKFENAVLEKVVEAGLFAVESDFTTLDAS